MAALHSLCQSFEHPLLPLLNEELSLLNLPEIAVVQVEHDEIGQQLSDDARDNRKGRQGVWVRAKVALKPIVNCIVCLNHVEDENVLYDANKVAQREECQRADQEALFRLDAVLHLSVEQCLQLLHQDAVYDHQLDSEQTVQHNLTYDSRLVILHDQ